MMEVTEDVEGTNATIEDVYRAVNTGPESYRQPESVDTEDFERVVESKTNRSVSYSDPMDNPVSVTYLVTPQWVPQFLKANSMRQLAVIILSLGIIGWGTWSYLNDDS